jgi:hypothetical protein
MEESNMDIENKAHLKNIALWTGVGTLFLAYLSPDSSVIVCLMLFTLISLLTFALCTISVKHRNLGSLNRSFRGWGIVLGNVAVLIFVSKLLPGS